MVRFKNLKAIIFVFLTNLKELIFFFLLLQCFLLIGAFSWLARRQRAPQKIRRLSQRVKNFLVPIEKKLDRGQPGNISQKEIIRLAISNMGVRKTRTLVTIGGMSIGIGAIVFLVSVGFGLQHLVVSRVASLEEIKQADVMPSQSGKLFIDDESLSKFKEISGIKNVFPLISLVGRINFKNSVTDAVVHGVTHDYLKNSAIRPLKGSFFASNETVVNQPLGKRNELMGKIAGAKVKKAAFNQEISNVNFKINEGEWIRIRKKPSTKAEILGYSRRVEGSRDGKEIWGGKYQWETDVGQSGEDENGRILGKWINPKVPLWKKTVCNSEKIQCENGRFQKIFNNDGSQLWQEGYFAEIHLSLTPEISGQVLAASTQSASATDTAELEISKLLGSTISADVAKQSVSLGKKAEKKAVINKAMSQILGLDPNKALGKKIPLSFIVVGNLIPEKENQKIESLPEEYLVIAVVPGEKNPVIWVPFIDLRSLGISRYSQARIMVNSKNNLANARKQIEAMGYKTTSVADTVNQINSLFNTIKIALALLGLIALSIASLGMFNTLTVSLLERTREVGVMKAMGMKSKEVKDLFLTESMIMGFFGGVLGISLGWLAGKLLSIILSAFAAFSGFGFIDIVFLPFLFIAIIIFLSFSVGFLTGLYPARRATKISALDALRYE